MMSDNQTINEIFNNRSGPVWRWLAGFLLFLNLLLLVQCVFSTFRPDLWATVDPFAQFTFLTVAIIFTQLTPFARSIWLGDHPSQNGEIDEYERLMSQKVMTNAYRTMAAAMIAVLFMLVLAGDFADVRLTAVSGGFWLMWFAQMFFSLPAIWAGFDTKNANPIIDED